MHALNVTLKDGSKRSGWLVTWRPLEGYFEMGDDEDGDVHRIELADVVDATQAGNRVSVSRADEDEDMLARAIRDGWKP